MATVEQYANNPSSTLSSSIVASDTTLTVASATPFSTSGVFRILVDSELMRVTSVSGATFTISRGVEGTTAASHSAGATVTQILSRDGLLSLGSQIHLSDSYAALPSSSLAGRLFLPTDGISILRDTSSSWFPWGPIYSFTNPYPDTDGTTTLSGNGGSITSGATSANVASSAGVPVTPFLVQIGTEDIKVTNVSGTTWTIVRGYNGTTAASHNDGDTVTTINWEWVNQGTASVIRTGGGIFLKAPATSGVNGRIRKRLAPATPYTITAYMKVIASNINFHQWGLCFRESSSGKLKVFDFLTQTNTIPILRTTFWTSPTVVSTAAGAFSLSEVYHWQQISDDGANRIFRVSRDGQNWIQWYSEGRTVDLTADEVGFLANAQSTTDPDVGLTLFSWTQT